MDFLDPKQRRNESIRLMIGYVLIGIAILLGTVILLYQAYGFGLSKGKIIQNGLVFVSSAPSGGDVYVNGQLKGTTSTRLLLESGNYTFKIQSPGYRTWQRSVVVDGGSVERIDYPFLFHTHLTTKIVSAYTANPPLVTQSLDRRWVLIEQPTTFGNFDIYDLSNPKNLAIGETIPAGLLTPASGAQSLSLIQWANDNTHVLLEHIFNGTYEYILFNRQDPTQSVNLTKVLEITPTSTLTLQNEEFDHYFVYDSKTTVLGTVDLSNTLVVPMLQYVISYKTYGSDMVLYATTQNAPAGKTQIMLYQGGKSYPIRTVTTESTYLLDLTQYNGTWYVAAGAQSENKIYVYQDPVSVLQNNIKEALVPIDILAVNKPTQLDFSPSASLIMAENTNSFAVHDIRYDKDYRYTVSKTFDIGQAHATWLGIGQLTYVSNGSLVALDYDGTNIETLQPAEANYTPLFDPSDKFVYIMAQQPATAKTVAYPALTSTTL